MISSIFKREIGLRRIRHSNRVQCDISAFLEQFESRPSDEYVVVGEEDGSSVPPLACSYCRVKSASHILGLVDENGYFVLYNTQKNGPNAVIKEWLAHSNAIFDLSWMEKEEKMVTASGDQTAILWDAPRAEILDVFKGHTSSVRSVSFRKEDDAVFATGSRDGHVMLWDKRCAKKDGFIPSVNIIRNAHTISAQQAVKHRKKFKLGPSLDSQQSVTVVLFQTDVYLITAGAVDGCVKIWDLRKTYTAMADPQPWRSFQYSGTSKRKHGYSSLTLDSSNARLFANCTDDVIYMYDLASFKPSPVQSFRGHQNSTFYVKSTISPDDQFLISGSSDEMAYIWQIDKPNRSPVVLKGHRAEVTDVAWSPYDLTKLATLSDDNTMRLWHLNRRVVSPAHGELTGTAEKTHREIGVSASPCNSGSPEKPERSVTVNPGPVLTSRQPKVVVKPNRASLCSLKLASPSLKEWFGQNKRNGTSIVKEKSSHESTEISQKNELSSENSQCEKLDKDNSDNSCRSRKSCKRRLVDDEATNNPSKRRNVLKDMGSNINTSPEKELHLQSPIRQPKLLSPDKISDIPSSLQYQFMSPKVSRFDPISSPRQSPTVNLPNTVFETPPRQTKHYQDLKNSPSTPKLDWLTKLRKEKGKLGRSPDSRKKLNSPYRLAHIASDMESPSSTCSQKSEENCGQYSTDSTLLSQSPISGVKSIRNYFQPLRQADRLEDKRT